MHLQKIFHMVTSKKCFHIYYIKFSLILQALLKKIPSVFTEGIIFNYSSSSSFLLERVRTAVADANVRIARAIPTPFTPVFGESFDEPCSFSVSEPLLSPEPIVPVSLEESVSI